MNKDEMQKEFDSIGNALYWVLILLIMIAAICVIAFPIVVQIIHNENVQIYYMIKAIGR